MKNLGQDHTACKFQRWDIERVPSSCTATCFSQYHTVSQASGTSPPYVPGRWSTSCLSQQSVSQPLPSSPLLRSLWEAVAKPTSGQDVTYRAVGLGRAECQCLWLLCFNIHLTLWRVIIFHSFYTSWYLLHPPSGINRAWGCKTEILLWRA